MSDKVFIDSNILIYAYSIDEPKKQNVVKNLLNVHDTIIISTQTINEFVNVTTRKKMLNNTEASLVVSEFFTVFLVETIDQKIIQKAIALVDKYRYSYFVALYFLLHWQAIALCYIQKICIICIQLKIV